ncbi:MAG: hypothetical protein AAGC55_16510 [Myxococcota bacterium]
MDARGDRASWPLPVESCVGGVPPLLPPELAPIVYADYRQVSADAMWASALVYYGSSLVGDADFRCLKLYLDNVLALDPRFYRVYRWAAYAVTFQNEQATQDEYRLSVDYLERGMEAFPDDYEFFWVAGIRYFLDLYSPDPDERRRLRERGAELIEQAMRKPNAPRALGTFAASLRMKLGQKERALQSLLEMIMLTESERARQVLIARYQAIAKTDFPDEARRVREQFERSWQRELPYASPHLYVILGDRPSAIIDFDQLATSRDLFGAQLRDDPPPAADVDEQTEVLSP